MSDFREIYIRCLGLLYGVYTWITIFRFKTGEWSFKCEQRTFMEKCFCSSCQPKIVIGKINWPQFTYCSHSTLPHIRKFCGWSVYKACILGPSWTCPLWHGQHCHGRCQQRKCSTLENWQSGNKDDKERSGDRGKKGSQTDKSISRLDRPTAHHQIFCKMVWGDRYN